MAGDNPEEPKPGSAEYDLLQTFLNFLQEPMPDPASQRTRIRRIGNRNLVIYPSGNTPGSPTTSGNRNQSSE